MFFRCRVVYCRVLLLHVVSFLSVHQVLTFCVLPYCVLSVVFHVVSSPALSHVLSYGVLSSPAMCCRVLSFFVHSCLTKLKRRQKRTLAGARTRVLNQSCTTSYLDRQPVFFPLFLLRQMCRIRLILMQIRLTASNFSEIDFSRRPACMYGAVIGVWRAGDGV